MQIIPANNEDFDMVYLKGTPHCKVHGAMNKVNPEGLWQCLAAHSVTRVVNGKSIGWKQNDRTCKAGCMQIASDELPMLSNSLEHDTILKRISLYADIRKQLLRAETIEEIEAAKQRFNLFML